MDVFIEKLMSVPVAIGEWLKGSYDNLATAGLLTPLMLFAGCTVAACIVAIVISAFTGGDL